MISDEDFSSGNAALVVCFYHFSNGRVMTDHKQSLTVLIMKCLRWGGGSEEMQRMKMSKSGEKKGKVASNGVTFNVKHRCCLVGSTVTYVLSFVLVPNFLEDKGSAFALGLDGHHLRGLEFSFVVVPNHIDIFVELAIKDNLVLLHCSIVLQLDCEVRVALWNGETFG